MKPYRDSKGSSGSDMELASPVIAVVGPTAVGKSAVAQQLAEGRGTAVLSADSMQVYREMNIGTAKLACDQQIVPHFGLDLVNPGQPYSAAQYQQYARTVIEAYVADTGGLAPIVSGGTGLYLRAALDDFDFSEERSPDTSPQRAALERLAEEIGPVAMHDRLAALDQASADAIHPNNVRRTIRALEMAQQGHSYADTKAAFSKRTSWYPTIWIGLTMDRAQLYQRINKRVDDMLDAGLLEEVRSLLNSGYRPALTAQQAIGYKELVPVIEGGADLEMAVSDIKQASRRYAKRQLSWFRSDPRVQWVDVGDKDLAQILKEVEALTAV